MEYALSPARHLWSDTVAVPRVIIEEHLKFVSARQLKALLFLLSARAEQVSGDTLASFLCCSQEELADIMEYWIASGIVVRGGAAFAAPSVQPNGTVRVKLEAPEPKKAPVHSVKEERLTKILDTPRLSPQDIINRGNEDARISSLLTEAQSVLCRTISHSEQEMLVHMVDYYGLRPEVILMILAYAKSVHKANTRYILTMAKNWGDEGIDSVEQAEQKLEEIARCDERWKNICTIAEIPYKSPTEKQRAFTNRWLNQWAFSLEMIEKAFEIARDQEANKVFPFVNGILKKWFDQGITTLSALAEKEAQPTRQAASGKGRITGEASYRIEQLEKDSFTETLQFGG